MQTAQRTRTIQIALGVICLLVGGGLIWWSMGQEPARVETTSDLLQSLDSGQTLSHGVMAQTDEGVIVEVIGADETRVELAGSLSAVYRLQLEFRANAFTSSVGVLLPVGDRHAHFVLRNEHGGFDGVDMASLESEHNPTRVSRMVLQGDDQPHTIVIECEYDGAANEATLRAAVDGETYAEWQGNAKTISIRADRTIEQAALALTLGGGQAQLLLSKAELIRVE